MESPIEPIADTMFGERKKGTVEIPRQLAHDLRLLLAHNGDIDRFHPTQVAQWKMILDHALGEDE